MSLLTLTAVSARLGQRAVLEALSLSLQAGEVLGVVGPNGAGKSSLLRAIAGLLPLQHGEVWFAGQALSTLDRQARARSLGYLPQNPQILWPLTVRELVALGRRPHAGRASAAAAAAAIDAALEAFELTGFAARPARALSGGEQMRVHLARLHAGQHALLLVDEPTAALDPRAQLQVLSALRALAAAGCGVLLVLHDLSLAARYCDRLLVLADGQAVVCDSPAIALSDARLAAVFGVRGIWQQTAQNPRLLGITTLESA